MDDVGSERTVQCPDCNEVGNVAYGGAQMEYEEWICDNSDCRVVLYEVYPDE